MNKWIAGLLFMFVLYATLNEIRVHKLQRDLAETVLLQEIIWDKYKSSLGGE